MAWADDHEDSSISPLNEVPNSPLATWVSQSDNNFSETIARGTVLPGQHHYHPSILKFSRAGSLNTSLAVNCRTDNDSISMASDPIPPLRRGNSVASTCSWTSIETTSPIDGGCVLPSDNGVLLAPDGSDDELVCPFQVLGCAQTFSQVAHFKMHVFSHFRSFPPPPFAPCFICGRLFDQQPDDDLTWAWNLMLDHMTEIHYRGTQETVRFHPSIAVMRYMWNKGIITDSEFERTQPLAPETRLSGVANRGVLPEAPAAPPARTPLLVRQHLDSQPTGSYHEPFVVTAGRRQHRRHANRLGLGNRMVTPTS